MLSASATVRTVSSVGRLKRSKRGKSVVLIGIASYTEPITSPAMAPSIGPSLRQQPPALHPVGQPLRPGGQHRVLRREADAVRPLLVDVQLSRHPRPAQGQVKQHAVL